MGLDFIIPGLLLVVPIAAVDIYILEATAKELLGNSATEKNWRRIALISTVGIALGVCFTFFVEYKLSAIMRLAGFPIPMTISHLENDQWTHSATPLVMQILGGATDFLTGLAAACLPQRIKQLFRRLRKELSA
jgi:hypothetical protein